MEKFTLDAFVLEYGIKPSQWIDLRQFITPQHMQQAIGSPAGRMIRKEFFECQGKHCAFVILWRLKASQRKGPKLLGAVTEIFIYIDEQEYKTEIENYKSQLKQ